MSTYVIDCERKVGNIVVRWDGMSALGPIVLPFLHKHVNVCLVIRLMNRQIILIN